jgi:trehalose 6-phosphate synthase
MGYPSRNEAEDRISFSLSTSRRTPQRLLVMSNRAPIRLVREAGHERILPTVGGVGTTFLRLLERYGGLWIAWSGMKNNPGRMMMPPGEPRFAMVFPSLSEREIANYYWGMCNRGLWPLMHFVTPTCHFDAAQWKSYCQVNRTFAASAQAEAGRYDVAWIQDFHLALVPSLIREAQPEIPIGLFWHVPWPPEQFFRVFPWRKELLAGMLGSDLIGFHIPMYAKHFLDCCERILGAEVERASGEIRYQQRRIHARAFPLGIPSDYFRDLSASAEVQAHARRIRRAMHDRTIVLGVDRLDYTKGVIERLLGFERFLELYPEYRGKVSLVLIAVPSRTKVAEYAALKRQLDETVGRVVGRFSLEGYTPIHYLYTQFEVAELIAYYQSADIALLTPLRDGMNLVAKEFVASQLDDNAVLILSEFAGAAEELKDALLVNPYSIDEVAARLKQAVEMPEVERRARLSRMRAQVEHNNLEFWSQSFLRALTPPIPNFATRSNGFSER